MVFKTVCLVAITSLNFSGCLDTEKSSTPGLAGDTVSKVLVKDNIPAKPDSSRLQQLHNTNDQTILRIETGTTRPAEVVDFSKTLIGVPYKYASTDPAIGFDCSGFITHVFNHFGITVPRSSVDFTNVKTEIPLTQARPGDLILFTGTDSTIRIIGHMGIVAGNNDGKLEFIHSTSGKAKGVVITPFERYYQGRFVKVIRIFPAKFFE